MEDPQRERQIEEAAPPTQPVAARVANELALNVPLLGERDPPPRNFAQRLKVVIQALCAFVLMMSCCGSAIMIFSEALQGVRRSLYCSLGKHEKLAPVFCVLPLATAAVLCHLSVVVGLGFIAQFASVAGCRALEGADWHPADQRAMLQANLKMWRTATNKVLLLAAMIYLLAGPPCAGVARIAFAFLATGFLTLYATMLFFDDETDQARMPPRFLRFLGVYTLMGLTFTAYSWGYLERSGLSPLPWDFFNTSNNSNFNSMVWNATHYHSSDFNSSGELRPSISEVACTTEGRALLSPAKCTVPLDFVSGVSLWWVASPLFASFVQAAGDFRKLLQRWRRSVDIVLVLGIFMLTMILHDKCRFSSPVAFSFAELSACAVCILCLMRRLNPVGCDPWRGPLEHLVCSTYVATAGAGEDPQCSICLAELQGETICQAPCGHDFHLECLEEWVTLARQREAGCPLCRESLYVRTRLPLPW